MTMTSNSQYRHDDQLQYAIATSASLANATQGQEINANIGPNWPYSFLPDSTASTSPLKIDPSTIDDDVAESNESPRTVQNGINLTTFQICNSQGLRIARYFSSTH